MPIPFPKDKEDKNSYISRCVSFVKNEDPNMENEQAVTICMDNWRTSKTKSNQKLNFSLNINESSTFNNEFLIKGTAINAVTTRNGHTFLAEELSISANSLKGRPLLKDHTNTIDSIVGKVIDAFYDSISKSIKFTASIFDETIKQKIQAGLITSVSVGANVKEIEEGENGDVIVKGIEFVELSLVAVPADPNAGFAMAIMQSLITGNDVKSLEQSKGIPTKETQEKTEKMVEKIEEKTVVQESSKIEKMLESLIEQNRTLIPYHLQWSL